MRTLSHSARMILGPIALTLASPPVACADPILDTIRGVEQDLAARIGFFMHDTQTDDVIAYAAHDRFPLNSTFKLFACAAVLRQSDQGMTDLAKTVQLHGVQIVPYSPEIQKAIASGRSEISLEEACRMMLSVSYNAAANIILSQIGGPQGLTAFLRTIGDPVTRLDRWETALNTADPGDPRDTTTSRAIAQSLRHVILGNVLSPASRAVLQDWLSDHRVADALFRAALPPDWSIQDRTGAGGFGSRSIIAILYPPDRLPIIVALFMTQTDAHLDRRNAAAARIGNAIVAQIRSAQP